MSAVLYDAPGPRTRRRILIGSVVAGVVLALTVGVVVLRLADQDQFAPDKWSALFNPADADFADLWRLLGGGLRNTLTAAILAIVLSLVIGTLLAVTRITAHPTWRWGVVGVIEVLRGIPVVMLIFFAARVLPEVGVDLSLMWYLVIGLTAYNAVVIAEIVRAGVASIPRGQSEAASAIGLTRGQTLRLVLLPQAFRIMLPALISQLVVVLKDTSLGFIISYEELLRRGQFAIQNLQNPLQLYLVIALIFIAVNYGLGRLAGYAERRVSRSSPAAPVGGTVQEGGDVLGGGDAIPSRTGG